MARIPSGMRKKANGLLEKRFTVNGKRYSAYGHNVKECADNEITALKWGDRLYK